MKKTFACIIILLIMSACQTQEKKETPSNTNGQTQETTKQPQELTQEEAVQIAMDRAKATKDQVAALQVKRDLEHGVTVYEIEFIFNQTEFSYEIRATDGTIIKESSEVQKQSQTNTNTSITLEDAQQLVLEKVPGATTENLNIHSDYEDGNPTFEGEVIFQGMEYEFELNANTGNFIKWKEEVWD